MRNVRVRNPPLFSHLPSTYPSQSLTTSPSCVNNYTASYHGTTFNETITSTWTNTSYNSSLGRFDIWLLPSSEDATSFVPYPAANEPAYVFHDIVKLTLQSYFDTVFSGYALDSPPYVIANTEELITLFSMSDVARTWTNMARSITKAMRESKAPADSSVAAEGTAWVVEPRVRVQWAYLLLPAVLELLTLVFTGLTIAKSRAGGWRVWKTSVLPVLRCGMVMGRDEGMVGAREVAEMEGVARGVRIELKAVDGVL